MANESYLDRFKPGEAEKARRRGESSADWSIPEDYGDNKIVIMVRDPWTLFAYWEISAAMEESIKDEIRRRGFNSSKRSLRVFEPSNEDATGPLIQYNLMEHDTSRYVHTGRAGGRWQAEIARVTDTGEVFSIARSNIVETPQHKISELTEKDEMTMKEELYKELMENSITRELGRSSPGFKELINKHLEKWMSSGSIGGPEEKEKDKRSRNG